MERLTEYEQISDGERIIWCNTSHERAMERLAAYEDTGLTPEEVTDLQRAWDMYGGEFGITEMLKAPAADVAPVVHGKWVVIEDIVGEMAKCSKCGFHMGINEPGNGIPNIEYLRYCPHCGAKMDEEKR